MKRMLVIGIGSLIMTDDGIGTRVAGAIQGRLRENGIAVIIGETDVQFCLDAIQPDDFLIIIDSMMQGKKPGDIEIVPLQDALKSRGKFYFQHDVSLIDALLLNFPYIEGFLIGIEASEIGLGFDLSEDIKNSFERICNDAFNAILEIKGGCKNCTTPT